MSRLVLLLPICLLACSEYDLNRGNDAQPPEEEEETTPPDPENPDIRVEPSSIDFDFVPRNCDSSPEEVTVSNIGGKALLVSDIMLAGADAPSFRLEHAESDFSLAPGESTVFEVIFTPSTTDASVADIQVHSNDPDEPEAGVVLDGMGADAGTYEEIFYQEAFSAVDILWVVDNSGSMSDAVDHVYENFSLFIDPFLAIGLDFQMGVITTDMANPTHQGRLQGVPTFITGDSANPSDAFLAAIDQGSSGSGDEQGLAAIQAALSEPLVSSHNAGFLRDDAHLVTIVVTDEDDSSDVSASSFISWYWSLKDFPDMVSFSAFCGDEPWGCYEWVSWSEGLITAEGGGEYIDVINQVGGVFASICSDDFSDALSLLSLEASGLTDTFPLAAVPTSIGDMEVLVNGVEARYDNVDGWQLDWGLNAVVFYGAAIPPAGSTVEVSYPYEGGC